jgi:hypothetical protein
VEDFSRRVLAALLVAAAGPAAGALTLLLVGPSLVAATSPETDGDLVETMGSLLVGLVIGATLAAGIAYAVAAAATLVALRFTGCPRAHLAWVICLAASPVWIGALSAMALDPTAFLVLAGVLPGAVSRVRICTAGAREHHRVPGLKGPQDSGSSPISRTSWAQRQASAILAAQASASSREETSRTENPPTTAFVSGTGPSTTVPSVATMLAC